MHPWRTPDENAWTADVRGHRFGVHEDAQQVDTRSSLTDAAIFIFSDEESMSRASLSSSLLSLIDMALVGGLLVMVMISGYENFVSQLDIDDSKEKLNWLGTMDSLVAEDEGGRVDRGDLVHPPAADLHGRQERRSRAFEVVRDHSHDLRGVGVCHGLPG